MTTLMDMEDVTARLEELNAADRCDRCFGQARAIAVMPSGYELLFCLHHVHENREALEDQGARVVVSELPEEVPA